MSAVQFGKLNATSIEQLQAKKSKARGEQDSSLNGSLAKGVNQNLDAAVAISGFASLGKDTAQLEVARESKEASSVKLEDVDRLVSQLATRISREPDQALAAHDKLEKESVQKHTS